jgi:hypothetical protein
MKVFVATFVFHIWLFFHIIQFTTATKWAVATDDKCVFTVSGNWTVLFEVHPSLFVTYLAVGSPSECRTSCCEHHSCNGYVYDSSSVQDSCKLLKCSREGLDCKDALVRYNKPAKGEVGFITGLADNSETVATSSTHNNNKPKGLDSSAKSHETSLSHHDDDSEENKGKASGETESDNLVTTARGEQGTTTSLDEVPEEEMGAMNNLTDYGNSLQQFPVSEEDIKEHTNSISLTIAFLFGIGFLVTVLYLTGRRWLEGLKEEQQKGYTRISYLLNGV